MLTLMNGDLVYVELPEVSGKIGEVSEEPHSSPDVLVCQLSNMISNIILLGVLRSDMQVLILLAAVDSNVVTYYVVQKQKEKSEFGHARSGQEASRSQLRWRDVPLSLILEPQKGTHVSLASSLTPGPSSGVRAAYPRGEQDPLNPGLMAQFTFLPFGSFTMSLDYSDDYNIPDADLTNPALEDVVLPKFDMHLYHSSLTKTHVTWLVKCYGSSEDLHPRVVPNGMTMDQLPNDAIGLYVHHFRQASLRVRFSTFFLKVVEYFCVHISQLVPIGINRTTISEMYCRALGIVPNVPLFRAFYKLCKQGNWFSFQSRTGKNCKPCFKDASTSLKKWKDKFFLVDRRAAPIAMAWRHHDSSVADPFPKPTEYSEQDVAKLREVMITLHKPAPSLLYVDGLSRVWKNVGHVPILKGPEGKVAVGTLMSPDAVLQTHLTPSANRLEDIPPKTGDMEVAELACRKVLDDKEKKKKKAEAKAAAKADDDVHIEKVVSRKRASEGESPRPNVITENVEEPPIDERANDGLDNADPVNEGHGDNAELSGLRTHPSPVCQSCYSAERFGNLPFTPQWGLTDSNRMDNTHDCRDMMSNLFTLTDAAQQQENVLLRFEALSEEHADLVYAHESCKDTKARYKECKNEMAKLQSTYDENVSAYDQLSQDYNGALVREKGLQERVEELEEEKKEMEETNAKQAGCIKQLEEDSKKSEEEAHQVRLDREKFAIECGQGEMSLGEAFSLAVGKGFMDDISIGRKDEDIQAILKATPNVDPASSSTFMEQYPYVDKVVRAYLLDHTGLQNVIPDETGLTPGQGPRDTPTTSYG
ncbi:hypothetical protein Tco_1564311 [Tanacetum coccineum]